MLQFTLLEYFMNIENERSYHYHQYKILDSISLIFVTYLYLLGNSIFISCLLLFIIFYKCYTIVGRATYMLRAILNEKNISLYELEKSSHVSHATLNDIYNERSTIDNCSIGILNKISQSLNMSVDELYKKLSYKDLSLITYDEDFDLFKSNVLQHLMQIEEEKFSEEILKSNIVENYFNNGEYLKAIYIVALIDYLMKDKPKLKEFEHIRQFKLKKIYVSKSIYLLLVTKNTTLTKVYKGSINEFLKHNIIEGDIENVA